LDAEHFVSDKPTVAGNMLTEHELRLLGSGLAHAWPAEEALCFEALLEAIDEADLRHLQDRQGSGEN
jgi:hypothetical protein